jgi:hypothetical protein
MRKLPSGHPGQKGDEKEEIEKVRRRIKSHFRKEGELFSPAFRSPRIPIPPKPFHTKPFPARKAGKQPSQGGINHKPSRSAIKAANQASPRSTTSSTTIQDRTSTNPNLQTTPTPEQNYKPQSKT